MITRTIRRLLLIGLLLFVGFWLIGRASELIVIGLVSCFLALAILPAVDGIVRRRGWNRGLTTLLVIIAVFFLLAALIGFLIPALADVAGKVGGQVPNWLDALRGTGLPLPVLQETNDQIMTDLENWLRKEGGTHVLDVAGSSLGLLAKLVLILVFTIVIASSEPNLLRAILGRLSPANQTRFIDAWDTAIVQTGGYFYSRLLLMFFTSTGTFVVMVFLGIPVQFAIPLAVFGAFFVEFIPLVGGYIGIALPVLFVLVEKDLIRALILLGWAIIYQQIHDYVLSPRISSKTMSISAGVALGSALLGGAIAGPVGALFAMPVAGVITAFVRKYVPSHPIAVSSPSLGEPVTPDDAHQVDKPVPQ
jgi:predicted PurR-regulated permease PerM